MCLQDVRGGYEMLRAKVVFADWTTCSMLLDLTETHGEKKALEKSEQLRLALERFAVSPGVLEVLQGSIHSFCSDGERAEPLAARFCKDTRRFLPHS